MLGLIDPPGLIQGFDQSEPRLGEPRIQPERLAIILDQLRSAFLVVPVELGPPQEWPGILGGDACPMVDHGRGQAEVLRLKADAHQGLAELRVSSSPLFERPLQYRRRLLECP